MRLESRVLTAAATSFCLVMLDLFMVSIALPGLVKAFDAGSSAQLWILNGQTVVLAAFLHFAGNLTDRIGAARAFMLGVALLAAASLGAAIAPSVFALICARCVQGFSAALILPASMSLLRAAFPDPRKRTRALGTWAIGGAVATAVGPPLGGLLVSLDWRFVFLVNIPVCAVIALLLRGAPTSEVRRSPVDWAGQGIAVVTLVSLTAGLIQGGSSGFGQPLAIVLLSISFAGIVCFVLVERRQKLPLLPPSLFQTRNLKLIFTAGVTYMLSWYGTVLVLSIYLQQQLHMTALAAGLVFLPTAAVCAYSNVLASQLTARFGARIPASIGQLAVVVGSCALLWAATRESPMGIALAFSLVGLGGSFTFPPLLALLLTSVPSEPTGIASGAFNTARQIGASIAVAVFGSFIANASSVTLGAELTFIVGAVVALSTLAIVLSLRSSGPRQAEEGDS